jgi:hypothetical protein
MTMKGDFTRNTFRRDKHYSSVRMQQGRVQLDADWNEQLDIQAYRYGATHGDVIGYCGGPKGNDAGGNALAGFEISAADANLLISKGRYYVNGILCENEADVLLTEQADLPGYDPTDEMNGNPGVYLAYLDVWERHMTALDDEEIREVALGGPDTATRTRVVWQVKVEQVGDVADALTCDAFGPGWTPAAAASSGVLAARSQESGGSTNPCIIPPKAGYRRLENQLYRVEIHDAGDVGEATFKWSRENGSIVMGWADQDGNNLTMSSAGRDRSLGFAAGDWIELTNDDRELNRRPGVLVQLDRVDGEVLTIDPTTIKDPDDSETEVVDRANFLPNPKIRRWESAGAEDVTVPAGDDGWLELEDGVEIQFQAGGVYQTGDYWTIPARTALGNVLWPQDEITGEPEFQPAHGIEHAYCPLALVTWQPVGEVLNVAVEDCRFLFPPLTYICAEDVCFDNGRCDLPGAETVQDALDRLCERNDLPHHNRHLHGWGIVCGLQVVCGPDRERPRRHVTVREGYALDCDGNDVILDGDRPLDILEMIRRQGEVRGQPLLDDNGDGDLCLILRSDPRQPFALEPYDPTRDRDPWQALLAGTLLMDFYDHCIRQLVDFVREEFEPPEEGQPAGPVEERLAAFTNLIAQPINPTAGQHIFLSQREHRIIGDFYVRLRALLRSESYCAMFDNARPFPEYPEEFLEAGMDTVFGKSFHTRLRLRPRSTEGYTVGEGLHPLGPSTTINRYELAGEDRRLISQIDPLAGSESDRTENDSGAGAVQDVAFSLDGRRIYVIIASRDDEDTFFRVGDLRQDSIRWRPLSIICGIKLVTLATTPADPNNVYAVGMKKVTIVEENGEERAEFRGVGLFRISPDDVDPELQPIAEFNASGHLQISEDGRAFATAARDGISPLRYDRIVPVRVVPGNTPLTGEPIELGATGNDDIAIRTGNVEVEAVYTVVDPQQQIGKQIVAHSISDGRDLRVQVSVANTAIRLAIFRPTNVLLITAADGYNVQLIDLNNHQFEEDYLLPMQVGPAAIAADAERGAVYVLNTGSNTITTAENREVFQPQFRFDLERLAQYRAEILNAFTDLLAGLLQYLKDCFCHLLLVNCPECGEDEKIYLACVSIRGGEVERVCNFSQRRYVKSFPTMGYWLSLVPVAPVISWAVEQFCCMVLPDLFGRVATEPTPTRYNAEYQPRVGTGDVFQGSSFLRNLDIGGAISRFTLQGRQARSVAVDRMRAAPSAAPAARPARPIVDQPVERVEANLLDRGVTVRREPYDPARVSRLTTLFRTPPAGSEVTLYEEQGRVRYYDIRTPEPAAPAAPAELHNQVETLSKTLEARETELQSLRTQVETLTRQQSELESLTSRTGVAELRAEVEELRQFRQEVTRFMRESRG